MRAETKEGLLLAGKSVLALLGAILVAAASVDLVVDGFSLFAAAYLLTGLLMTGLPLGFAFRDAVRR